jgi:hypothetical protein
MFSSKYSHVAQSVLVSRRIEGSCRRRTFQIYKQIVQPFWGLLIDIEDFETKLCLYLEERSATTKHPNGGKGVSSAWLGMLFAVLAVATNYMEHPYHKRVAISQGHGMSQSHPNLRPHLTLFHSSNIISLFETLKLLNPSILGSAPSPFDPGICVGK